MTMVNVGHVGVFVFGCGVMVAMAVRLAGRVRGIVRVLVMVVVFVDVFVGLRVVPVSMTVVFAQQKHHADRHADHRHDVEPTRYVAE